MEIRSLSIMLYKRFKILFRTRLRRKLDVYSKTNYCSDCDNYLVNNKGASCALDLRTIDACYKESRVWIVDGKVGPKYLPDAPKEIKDIE